MEQSQQKEEGQPILFIDIQETVDEENNKHVSFNLTPGAMQFLTQIQDRNIAVLCIAGPQRTGKSFLANRFLNKMEGFAIGPTTNPCTKGIWIWSKPVRLNETTDMIILDTEERDQTIDMKIFSISVLLSSMFIYNNLGHIDETAIENLSLVVKLSQNICLKKANEKDEKLGDFFPYFYWVLRDFSLDLKGMTPNQYLDQCLQPLSGTTQDILQKNEIRDKFKQFFRVRECEVLVRPLDEEDKLAKIESQDWNTLRPAFIEGVNNFEKKVLENIKPKTIQNKILTAKMFMGLTIEYLQAINSGGIPAILNSLDSVISSQIRKVFEETRGEFMRKTAQVFAPENLPMDEGVFANTWKAIEKETIQSLQQKSKNFIDAEQLITLRVDLQEVIESENKIKSLLNQQIAQNFSLKTFQTIMSKLSLPNFTHADQITPNFVSEKMEDMLKLLVQFSNSAGGSYKYAVFFKQFPQKIFEYFNSIIQKLCILYSEDHQRTKVRLQQSVESQELIKNQITQYEKWTMDLQREVEAGKSIVDTLKREQNWLKKNQESNDKTQFGKIEELEMQLAKKKTKIQKYKAENSDLQEYLHRTRIESNQRKIESQGLKKENEELRKFTVQSANGDISGEQMPEIINSIKELKNQVQFMDNFFSSKGSLNSTVDSQQGIQLQEFEQFRQEKMQLKKDYKAKLDSVRTQLESEKADLVKKIDIQIKYIDDLRAKNMELLNQNEEAKKKLISVNSLVQENEKLREGLLSKEQNLDTTTQVLKEFSKVIEKSTSIKLDLENQLAYIKSENCKLMSFKETFPYILRESLKYVLNRNSKLKHSLKPLNDEDVEQVKSCFTEVGYDLKL